MAVGGQPASSLMEVGSAEGQRPAASASKSLDAAFHSAAQDAGEVAGPSAAPPPQAATQPEALKLGRGMRLKRRAFHLSPDKRGVARQRVAAGRAALASVSPRKAVVLGSDKRPGLAEPTAQQPAAQQPITPLQPARQQPSTPQLPAWSLPAMPERLRLGRAAADKGMAERKALAAYVEAVAVYGNHNEVRRALKGLVDAGLIIVEADGQRLVARPGATKAVCKALAKLPGQRPALIRQDLANMERGLQEAQEQLRQQGAAAGSSSGSSGATSSSQVQTRDLSTILVYVIIVPPGDGRSVTSVLPAGLPVGSADKDAAGTTGAMMMCLVPGMEVDLTPTEVRGRLATHAGQVRHMQRGAGGCGGWGQGRECRHAVACHVCMYMQTHWTGPFAAHSMQC